MTDSDEMQEAVREDQVRQLRTLADSLGYDVVKRVTAQEAHEELLKKRVEENGPEAVPRDSPWQPRDRHALPEARLVPRVSIEASEEKQS